MGTIIVIVGAVLIALIVGIGTYYKRKLRKQYQKQPYQSVTGIDLEAELKGEDAYKHYKRRQDRLTMLITALCAAVVIMGGLVYGSVTWWQESEPERIARAEQKRIEKAEKQRLQKEAEQEAAVMIKVMPKIVANACWCSKNGVYARFVEYKTSKMVEILAEQKNVENDRVQFETTTAQQGKQEEFSGKVRYDEYQKLYDDMLSEQKSAFNKVQKLSFEKWVILKSYIYEAVLLVIFIGLCVWSYKKKSYKAFLWTCLGVGIAFVFGVLYWGTWLNEWLLLSCAAVLLTAGLWGNTAFNERHFTFCIALGMILLMLSAFWAPFWLFELVGIVW